MSGLLESFAGGMGWTICECNVIVEGTSDVGLFSHAAELHKRKHGRQILGDRLAILPAGRGQDGGVDGVNNKLNAARQIANVDRDASGAIRHRFIGLYDNDKAGRVAIKSALQFGRRLARCGDVFLLRPTMSLGRGASPAELERRFDTENAAYRDLDWEIEDCLSDRLIAEFRQEHPNAVVDEHELGDRTHYEFSAFGKSRLHEFATEHAQLDDLVEIVKVIRALHDYFGLDHAHIVV